MHTQGSRLLIICVLLAMSVRSWQLTYLHQDASEDVQMFGFLSLMHTAAVALMGLLPCGGRAWWVIVQWGAVCTTRYCPEQHIHISYTQGGKGKGAHLCGGVYGVGSTHHASPCTVCGENVVHRVVDRGTPFHKMSPHTGIGQPWQQVPENKYKIL